MHSNNIKCLWSECVIVRGNSTQQSSGLVSVVVEVRSKSSSHCDRSGVGEGEVVKAELQTLPGGAKRLPNILMVGEK